MNKVKSLSSRDYVNLCIQNYNSVITESQQIANAYKAQEHEIQSMNESLINMQAETAKIKNSYQKFSEDTKSMFLAECIYDLLHKAMGIHMESTVNNNIKRGLVNNFIKENGVNNLLGNFKTGSVLLAEYAYLVNKYHAMVLESVDKKKPETFTIVPEIKDKFFEELNIENSKSVVDHIRNRVSDAMEEFIQGNINNKLEIEDTIRDTQEKIEKAKTKEVKESYEMLAKKKISTIKSKANNNVFGSMVKAMSEHVMRDPSVKDEYLVNNKIDIDKIVERCEILYTFLETINTAKIVKVDEAYIKEILDNMK